MTLNPVPLAGLLAGLLLIAAPAAAQQEAAPAAPAVPAAPEAPPVPGVVATNGERVVVGDHTVEAGDEIDEIVVVGGDLRIRGTVREDAVVVGGNLILDESGSVLGDALVTDGEILNRGGTVRGEMRAVEALGREMGRRLDVDETVRAEVEREIRREVERARGTERSWFEPIREGFAGLISTLALGLVLAGLGAGLVFYGRTYLETVSDTVRGSTWRSFAVGLAANFLAVPLWITLIVVLAVTIIGIPLLLVAVPLYPVVFALAAAFGLLAVAHAIGERTAEQQEMGSFRYRNSYAYLFTGLGMLLAPLVVAHLVQMTGFLGFIGTALQVITWVALWLCATAGLGAVVLSRAGTRRTFVHRAAEPTFEPDPLFDDEPNRETHV